MNCLWKSNFSLSFNCFELEWKVLLGKEQKSKTESRIIMTSTIQFLSYKYAAQIMSNIMDVVVKASV